MNRTSDFREKEVINIKDGRRLGFVSDVEINLQSGRRGRLLGLIGRDNECVIPWEKIKKIGEDIILVEMDDRFIRKHFE